MSAKRTLHPANATYTDWNEMQFWIWAAEETGRKYLDLQTEWAAFDAARESTDHQEYSARFRSLMQRDRLGRYQFMMAVGRLMSVLKIAQKLFPAIQPAYSRSTHLLTEGLSLRGLMEHEQEYFDGGGKFRGDWERESEDGMFSADASSVVQVNGKTLLGGRLSVQKVMQELAELKMVADTIAEPQTDVG